MILEAQFSDAARSRSRLGLFRRDPPPESRPRWSVIVGAPIDDRAARTRHPDAVALDGGVEFAAALVLQVEGVEVGEQL
jgi:hypothetical protein